MIRSFFAVLLCLPNFVQAQTAVTNTFQDGSTASANEVNENFQDLVNAIDNIVEPPTNCSTNQIIKWNGVSWACADDATGSGSGITIPTNCSTNQIIKWNGVSWACADDATGSGSGITLQSVRDAVDRRSTTSTNANVVVYCNSGEKVTGGGYRDDTGGAAPTLCETFVPAPNGASTDGYRCKWANSGVSRTVYAICL